MTEDVFSLLAARRRPGQVIVGFAAEDAEGPIESARGELERKRLDLLVVNGISLPGIGLEVSENATAEARGRATGVWGVRRSRSWVPENVCRAVWVLAAGVDAGAVHGERDCRQDGRRPRVLSGPRALGRWRAVLPAR